MAFDRRKMRFYNGIVLTQAQWDEIQSKRPRYKLTAASLIALSLGVTLGAISTPSSPKLPDRL